jgi:hypothetical protein
MLPAARRAEEAKVKVPPVTLCDTPAPETADLSSIWLDAQKNACHTLQLMGHLHFLRRGALRAPIAMPA